MPGETSWSSYNNKGESVLDAMNYYHPLTVPVRNEDGT